MCYHPSGILFHIMSTVYYAKNVIKPMFDILIEKTILLCFRYLKGKKFDELTWNEMLEILLLFGFHIIS